MARTRTAKRERSESPDTHSQQVEAAVRPRTGKKPTDEFESLIHVMGRGIICDTDRRGHATPHGRNPLELVVDASDGFIPLWESGTILRWRFRERSMGYFDDPVAAKNEIRRLFAEALLAWGAAAPVTFKYDEDLWDFEIVMRSADQCSPVGCVLASAFFPDGGRHELKLHPKMFTQVRKEQVDTLIHEIGHVFGLRHFFANVSENAWPSEIFGRHERFSIMNYGSLSELTEVDKEDLTLLYESAWNGELTQINGTPIRLVRPYSASASPTEPEQSTLIPSPFRQRMAPHAQQQPRPRTMAAQSRSRAAYLDG